MSTSQQLVLNKSLKVDIKVESSAPHWLRVAKNSPGIGSVQSLSQLIKAVTFCVRGIRDVFHPELTRENQHLSILDLQNWLECGPGSIDLCAFSFPLVVHSTFTTHHLAIPRFPANAPTCVSDMICSVIDAATDDSRTVGSGHLSLLYQYIFVWEWTKMCATGPLRGTAIESIQANCWPYGQFISVPWNCHYCLFTRFFINFEAADVYNAGKVTSCCGSECVLGHYSLSAAHHHWSHKGLSTDTDKNIHRSRDNMWPFDCVLEHVERSKWLYEKMQQSFEVCKGGHHFHVGLL